MSSEAHYYPHDEEAGRSHRPTSTSDSHAHESTSESSESGPVTETIDFRRLIRNLGSAKEHERLTAEREMKGLGARTVSLLLTLIDQETRIRSMWSALLGGITILAIPSSLIGMAMGMGGALLPVYVLLMILILAMVNLTRPTYLQKRAAQELARCEDVRAIGPLVDGLESNDHYTRSLASDALTRILFRLNQSEARDISTDQLRKLSRTLESEDHNLVMAALSALEQIGDQDALPFVLKLTSRPAMSEKERRVLAAAEQCLSSLKVRMGDGAASRLLRPSRSMQEENPTLLRPFDCCEPRESELLLRTSDEPESGVV